MLRFMRNFTLFFLGAAIVLAIGASIIDLTPPPTGFEWWKNEFSVTVVVIGSLIVATILATHLEQYPFQRRPK